MFSSCINLRSVSIPSTVTSITQNIFSWCSSLEIIDVDDDNQYFKSVDNVLFNKSGTTLISYAAAKSDTSYVIPNGVTAIEPYAFSRVANLTSVTFPDGVGAIPYDLFYNCFYKVINVFLSIEHNTTSSLIYTLPHLSANVNKIPICFY